MAQQIIINSRLQESGSSSACDFYYNLKDLTDDDDELEISISNISIQEVTMA